MPNQYTGHRLQRNHSSPIPRHIISIATARAESARSASGDHTRFLLSKCVSISTRIQRGKAGSIRNDTWTSKQDFWNYVYSKTGTKGVLWLVGHGILHDITLLGFASEIEQSRLVLDRPRSSRRDVPANNGIHSGTALCCLDSPPTIVGCRCVGTQGRLVIVDLQNWFRETIHTLGLACGVDVLSLTPPNELPMSYHLPAEVRADIVSKTFIELVQWTKAADLGVFRYSAAGQSMSAFRHKYMSHDILIHDNAKVKELERASFFGGRTEVFRRGKINSLVYQLDVNGLYPFIMSTHKFPTKLQEYGEGGCRGLELLKAVPQRMVASVTLKSDLAIYPSRARSGILYPTGVYDTCLCGEELKAAVDNDHVIGVRGWSVYNLDCIFATFVAGFSDLRQHYKSTRQQLYAGFCKLILNSLYGKFGQRAPRWADVPGSLAAHPWSSWLEYVPAEERYRVHRSVGYSVQRQTDREEVDGSFVAIPAFVCSAGRVYMNKLRSIAGASNVYYQGCDSLIVSKDGHDRLDKCGLLCQSTAGLLKTEIVADTANIFGCQDYSIGDKTVISGRCPEGSYIDVARMRQLRATAQAELFHGRAIDHVDEMILPWNRKSEYYKGVVADDGWISPISMTGEVSSPDTSVAASATIN